MHTIEIYGFAATLLCAGCPHEHESAACGSASCSPGGKRPTHDLVAEFTSLIAQEKLPVTVTFYEATDENIARHADVQKILSMADLSPAVVMDGKIMFLGGFSPAGLVEEVKKALNGK